MLTLEVESAILQLNRKGLDFILFGALIQKTKQKSPCLSHRMIANLLM